ncbi:MAG: cation:proton antiporter [Thermoleophilia bacterium]
MTTADTVAYVLIDVVAIVALARILGSAMRFVGQPVVVGEILAGVALGPTILGKHLSGELFPAEARPVLSGIATIALCFFMFLVGLDLDMSLLRGRVRATAAVAVAAVAVPFAAGFGVAPLLHDPAYFLGPVPDAGPFALFVGAALTVTAFPVMARILIERRLMRTPMGAVGVSAAAAVTIALFTLVGVAAGAAKGEGPSSTILKLAAAAGFLAFMFAVVRPLLARLGAYHDRAGRLTPNVIATVFVLVTLTGWATDRIGVNAVIGPFVLGLCMPRREGISRELTERIESFAVLFLLPVFFGFSGLSTDLRTLEPSLLVGAAVFIAAGMAAKWVPVALAARTVGLTWREGHLLGVLMSCRGLLPLIVAQVGATAGVIEAGGPVYAILVVYAIVTTVLTNPLANRFLPRKTAAPAEVPAAPPDALRILVAVGPGASPVRVAGLGRALAGTRRPVELVVAQPAAMPDPEVRAGITDASHETARTLSGLVPLAAVVGAPDVRVTPVTFTSTDPAEDFLRLVDRVAPDYVAMGIGRRDRREDLATVGRVAAGAGVPVAALYDPTGEGLVPDGRPVVSGGADATAELLAAGLGTRVAADAPQGASAIVIPMSGDWSAALTAAHGPVVVVSEGGGQPPR